MEISTSIFDQHKDKFAQAIQAAKLIYPELTDTHWNAFLSGGYPFLATFRSIISDGYMPVNIVCPGFQQPFVQQQLTKEQLKDFPKEVVEAIPYHTPGPTDSYCFTRGEDWWHGPVGFWVRNSYDFVMMLHYKKALKDPQLQLWQPKSRRGAAKATGNALYDQWLAICADRRRRENELREELDEAMQRVIECRAAIRRHESDAVSWADYRDQHTM